MSANPTAAKLSETTPPPYEEIFTEVVRLIAEVEEREPADVEAKLKEGGAEMPIDSLTAVEIMLALEDKYGFRFPDDDATCEAFQTVDGLIQRVQTLCAESHE
jgi:acyl carrier protein